MLERFRAKESTPIDVLIARVIEEMGAYSPVDPEYKSLMKYLERLNRLKQGERRERVKADTIWIVVGNLAIAVLVVSYERNHVIVTRLKDYIFSPKI